MDTQHTRHTKKIDYEFSVRRACHASRLAPNATACSVACRAVGPDACAWWQLEVPPSEMVDGTLNSAAACTFKAVRGNGSAACATGSKCAYGPAICSS